KGSVDMDDGTFENVLYVPNLSTNLLSIYQITHYGNGKKVEFTPDSVVVKELDDDALVAVGQVNDNSRLYSFSHFVPSSPSRALLTHSNSESKLWHERFGHLNYHYL
ncbi:GAG-pre-integrase domain-containing protein, partial [Klebsiella pneumoniae]